MRLSLPTVALLLVAAVIAMLAVTGRIGFTAEKAQTAAPACSYDNDWSNDPPGCR